jgi:hypothetical protein
VAASAVIRAPAHGDLSGASATVLASFFGKDAIPFGVSWEGLPGVTRSFTSFSAAEQEAGQSRIWVGFHWSFDVSAGLAQGQSIGSYISTHYLLPLPRPGSIRVPAGGDVSVLLAMNSVPAGREIGTGPVGETVFALGPGSRRTDAAGDGLSVGQLVVSGVATGHAVPTTHARSAEGGLEAPGQNLWAYDWTFESMAAYFAGSSDATDRLGP